MSRSTIDFGIDLGTTNSAIAVLDNVDPTIIKNTDDQDATPSAVFINKQGVMRVGGRAKNAVIGERSRHDAHTEFKRQMGTPYEYLFKSSGIIKKPEELSAEVLKELRASVEAKTGELISSSVITVPAAFELHQCDATKRAAELAGLTGSPLLQEPVAAALAYGFQADTEKAYWMVYDFGGGTFDAALIKAEDGMINVVHHGGDNFLGGSDIDWAITEKIIIPRLTSNFDLPDFNRASKKWGIQLKRIKHAIEAAKMELSTKEETTLTGDIVFEDESGEEVECDELSLTRDDLIRVAEPLIARSVEISQNVLQEKNLGLQAVEKVIVVGGPTKAPYFRDILGEGLGIPIDFAQDPLTVVARGASVFASTQNIDKKHKKKASVGEFDVEISDKYKPVGFDTDPLIAGKVKSSEESSVDGFTVEFVNQGTQWKSGKVPLNSEGAFMANLVAEKGSRNKFIIELCDSQGTMQKAVPDHVNYTVGAVIEEQPLLKGIGLAKADNSVDWYFKAGSGLPQKKRWGESYRTTVALQSGQESDGIVIPIVEGEHEHADRNREVGKLVIDSNMIRRDLPVGTEVEITLRISESRTITLDVYVPILDEEFTEEMKVEKEGADAALLESNLRKEKERLEELRERAEDSGEDSVLDELDEVEGDKDRDQAVKNAKGDQGAAEKAQARLLEMQNKLDSLEKKLEWPSMVNEAEDLKERMTKLANEHGTTEHQDMAEDWCDDIDTIISKKQTDRLSRKLDEGRGIMGKILTSIPAFWVGNFQQLEREGNFSDPEVANRLITRGREYLQNNNIDGVTDVVRKLWSLLPPDVAERAQRGLGSTLL